MRPHVIFLFLSLILVAACGGKATPNPADGSLNGSGGSLGSDARLDGSSDGKGDAPAAIDAPGADLIAADRPSERPIDPVADGGIPDCGSGSLCWSIRTSYSETMQRAKSCTSGAGACGLKAPGSLGCSACQVWVSDRAELDLLRSRFSAAGCQRCFYGSPTGDRCHPVVCNDLGIAMCAVGPSGAGTCVDSPKDRTCPAGIRTGMACTSADDFCIGGGRFCTCDLPAMTWSC